MLSCYFHLTLKTRVLRFGAIKWVFSGISPFCSKVRSMLGRGGGEGGRCWGEHWLKTGPPDRAGLERTLPVKRTVPTPVLLPKALGGPLSRPASSVPLWWAPRDTSSSVSVPATQHTGGCPGW